MFMEIDLMERTPKLYCALVAVLIQLSSLKVSDHLTVVENIVLYHRYVQSCRSHKWSDLSTLISLHISMYVLLFCLC